MTAERTTEQKIADAIAEMRRTGRIGYPVGSVEHDDLLRWLKEEKFRHEDSGNVERIAEEILKCQSV